MALVNLLNLNSGENIAAVIPVSKNDVGKEDNYLTMVTRKGIIKKTGLSLYSNIRKSGLVALNIREDDALISVLRSDGSQSIIFAASSGTGIRFSEDDVRPTGRAASGVRAMKLRPDDYIVGAAIVEDGTKVLLVSTGGYGKCTEADAFKVQNRGGKGSKVYKTTDKTGTLIGVATVKEDNELMLINSEGVIIRMPVADISVQGRVAQGVKLIQMNEGVSVVGMATVTEVNDVE